MRKRTKNNHFSTYLLLVTFTFTLSACCKTSLPIGTLCTTQGECGIGQICDVGTCSDALLVRYDYTDKINAKAEAFLRKIKERELNVVTAESLTAGMIISSLANVPNFGSY